MAKERRKGLAKNLLEDDFDRLDLLAVEMGKLAATVDKFPEDIEYTQENLATLEDVRHEALELARNCEAAIETFTGE